MRVVAAMQATVRNVGGVYLRAELSVLVSKEVYEF